MVSKMARIADDEAAWLTRHYPGLTAYQTATGTIVEGRLSFTAEHGSEELSDSYTVKIEFDAERDEPFAWETGGRLRRVFDREKKINDHFNLIDLHIYKTKKLCLASPQEFELIYSKEPTLKKFIEDYLVPFFYSQSYFEKYSRWPWSHLPHGLSGIRAWLHDNADIPGAVGATATEIKRMAKTGDEAAVRFIAKAKRNEAFSPLAKCLCGSGKKHMVCHRYYTRLALALRG